MGRKIGLAIDFLQA